MTYFASKIGGSRRPAPNQLDSIVQGVQQALNTNAVSTPTLSRAALSLESIDESQLHALNSAADQLSVGLESVLDTLSLKGAITPAQKQAATYAGLLAGDPRAFMNTPIRPLGVSTENMGVVAQVGSEGSLNRALSLEAYDERDNRNAAIYSIAYNMNAARQDEFCETFFPTITVAPDQVGFGITVRLLSVMNDVVRSISGAVDTYGKKNLLRAVADPTILKNEMTRIVPVVRAQSVDKFVDPALVPVRTLLLEGEPIQTAPLAIGKKVGILGLSETDAMLNNGLMDVSDSVDTGIVLENVYLKVGNDVLRYNVSGLPLSNFVASVQNDYRTMTLNFATTSVLVNKDTKKLDTAPLVDLASVVVNDLILRLDMNITGTLNIETGETVVYGNHVEIHSARNAAGELLPLDAAPVAALVTLFADAKIIGYELKAYRANLNRRQRGQLINTTFYTQAYNVYLRSPITAIHPANVDGQVDTSDLQALITATRIRTTNAGVGTLVEGIGQLAAYVDSRDVNGVPPDVLGVGRFYVKPSFFKETLDMTTLVDSLKSHERREDIQAALVSKIRDYAYRMYRDSEYKVAADALAGGVGATPVVIVGTDPVLAGYLMVPGDLRTLSTEFDIRVVSTLDPRVAGKIFITFSVFDENRNTQPNPLSFGGMAWSPEVTIQLPISRNGAVNKETCVQPRFLHFINLPVATVLTVENVPDVLNKLPLFTNEI